MVAVYLAPHERAGDRSASRWYGAGQEGCRRAEREEDEDEDEDDGGSTVLPRVKIVALITAQSAN